MADLTVSADVDALMAAANNAAIRTAIGLGTMATQAASSVAITGGAVTGITDITVADGGTGASTAADARTNLGLGTLATQSGTFSGTSSGTNTGDQTNISGNAATVTTNANLTGHVTSTGNAAVLGAFTIAQLNTAISDGTIATGGGSATGTNTGDNAVNSLYSGLVSNANHSGDATGATVLTFATVNANVGAFGSATQASQVTVNAKGLVTAAANVTVTPAIGSVTGLGTGVGTALAVNMGTAGAPIVNGGALGTPSSGTLTSCTGLPISGLVASTSTAIGVGSVELGHASDTTLSRTGAGDVAIEGNAVYRAGGTDVPVLDGGTGASTAADARTNLQAASRIRTISAGMVTTSTGLKVLLPDIPFAGTIISWRLVANASDTLVIDIWKANASVPIDANSITASAKPTLTAAQRATSSTLTGWTTAVAVGDVFGFEVESATTATFVTLVLEIQETHA